MVTHQKTCGCYPLPKGSLNGLPRDRQRSTTPRRGKPLPGDTFVPLFSFDPDGLTFLLAWTCLAVLFSPKQFILSSSYAPDSSQVEDKKVVEEFNI
ncbi:MAG: hypothetical protein ACFFCZ_10125 [Promethearchaeota archaeon]